MSFYALLDVSRTAAVEDIRKAFKKAALKNHPDKGGDEEVFKLCCTALETLCDGNKRAAYDRENSIEPTGTKVWWADLKPSKPPKVQPTEPIAMNVRDLKSLLNSLGINHDDCFDRTELLARLSRKPRIKIISLGSEGVGKSCLIKRFCEGKFVDRYITTIGVDYGVKPVELKKPKIPIAKLNFFDFSGLRAFSEARSEFYRFTQGVALVFDLSNLQSFRNVGDWLSEARSHGLNFNKRGLGTGFVHTVLMGNKSDSQRLVTQTEGRELADSIGAKYFETSALTGEGVNAAFLHLAASIAS
jgi:DnaJ homolog subfamily C member 27